MSGSFANDRFQHPNYSAAPHSFPYHPYMHPHPFHMDRHPPDSYGHMYFQRYNRSPHCHSRFPNPTFSKNPSQFFSHPRIKRSNTVPITSIHGEQTPGETFSLYQGSCHVSHVPSNTVDETSDYGQTVQSQIGFNTSL